MMVALNTVRSNNASLKELGPGLVAVFGTLPIVIGQDGYN